MNTTNLAQEGYLEQILNSFPDGVFTINMELKICYVNPAFCRLLGFSEEELIGSHITEYLGDLKILDVCMKEVEEKGKCQDQETIFKRKDGSMVHISKNVQSLFDERGNFKEILVSIRDMTQLHQLNNDLADSKESLENYTEELEQTLKDLHNTQTQLIETEKMAALGSLVAGISHEINTPLGVSITSATALHDSLNILTDKFNNGSMKRTELEGFFSHGANSLDILYQNLKRASELVNTFKRIAVDQSQELWQTINIHDYLNDTINSLHPKFVTRNINISNQCQSSLKIYTHPGAIYQTFSNLIMNSLMHAFESDSTGELILTGHQQDQKIILTYKDNGQGMDSKTQKHIFDPFFTTKRGSGGTGLGLHIVYNLITSTLHGNIEAQSQLGQGTQFNITLPIINEEEHSERQ